MRDTSYCVNQSHDFDGKKLFVLSYKTDHIFLSNRPGSLSYNRWQDGHPSNDSGTWVRPGKARIH